jgi:hypothetical protein
MVFGLLRSSFRVVRSALNQKRLVVVEGDALDDAGAAEAVGPLPES